MGQGFSVDIAKLTEGSGDINGLLDRCGKVASDAIEAIIAMSGSAGHPGLEAALGGAAERGTRTYLDIGDAYRHVANGLTTTAGTYARTENGLAARIGQIARGRP